MDRLNELRGEAGGSKDSTLDTTSPPSESFISANESSSKYYSLSDVDSTFEISTIKDVSLPPAIAESDRTITEADELITNLSPIGNKSDMLDSYKIGKQIEAANILSGGVNIFDDNDNSYDGDELVIDVESDEKPNSEKSESVHFKTDESLTESNLIDNEMDIASKDTEVVLQIDGKNVDAIDIGNGLYLYRKEGQEELAAVQIIDDDQQQPSFKFLKVRENAEGNLEVYEEIEIEVSKEVPTKEEKLVDKNTSHVPIKDINKVMSDPTCNKVAERKNKSPQMETTSTSETEAEVKEVAYEPKTEVNLNGKMMKFSESRKSPVIGSFTPMTYHSTPNKEGKPLTKTMVDLQLHPNRHSDNVKKTIEVHTDSCKLRPIETQTKCKDEDTQNTEIISMNKEGLVEKNNLVSEEAEIQDSKCLDTKKINNNLELDKDGNEKNKSITTTIEADVIDIKENELVETDKLSKTITTTEEASKYETLHKLENDIEHDKAKDVAKTSDKAKEAITTNNKSIKETNKAAETKGDITTDNNVGIISNTLLEQGPVVTGKVQEGKQNEEVIPTRKDNTDVSQNTESELIDISKGIVSNINERLSKSIDILTQKMTHISSSNDQVDSILTTVNISKTEAKCNQVGNIEKQGEDFHRAPKQDNKSLIKIYENKEKAILSTSKVNISGKINSKEVESKKVLEIEQAKIDNATNITSLILPHNDNKTIDTNGTKNKAESHDKKEIAKVSTNTEVKPINNNNAAVPFGKWTDINRQEFLNKFKETKIPVNSSNGKQIKNSNDLNRRDVLKKIDSQRQSNTASSKAQDLQKLNIKNEIAFSSKSTTSNSEVKTIIKSETVELKSVPAADKKVHDEELPQNTEIVPSDAVVADVSKVESKVENTQRREVNTQDLIDKTIEGMISRLLVKGNQEETKNESKDSSGSKKVANAYEKSHPTETSLDEIEMKMNELHGIPFIERPPHELPRVYKPEVKKYTKVENDMPSSANKGTKIPNLLPFANKIQHKDIKENVMDVDSEEEIIEHEPITGDIEITKRHDKAKLTPDKLKSVSESGSAQENRDVPKKESIITENEFDRFARRNSITYENCITVNFDGKEPHNVIKTVKEKDTAPKTYSKNEILRIDAKSKLPHKHQIARLNIHSNKFHTLPKFGPASEDSGSKNYQSKLQIAYQTALTAKRQLDRPITIIEDKPVKVVFMDPNSEFIPSQLNVQGQELSPAKKQIVEPDAIIIGTCDSLDSDVLDTIDDEKLQDEVKTKTKHQRKQVLTPVEEPELELIEPGDIGIDVSPKKKRKTEENKADKNAKNLMHKKSYLLGRSVPIDDKTVNLQELPQTLLKDSVNRSEEVAVRKDAVSAIDNLVKAAELLETQAENMSTSSTSYTESQQNTPVKRGRGRPRKYPLPEGGTGNKVPSPQKKPRLIDAKDTKPDTVTDDDSSDGEIIRENWTMGKINENIVCPICTKLFRSENVVFKHVKHCTGPSPNRSDSDKRSPRRLRQSQESDTKSYENKSDSMEVDEEKMSNKNKSQEKQGTIKRKSKDSVSKSDSDKADVIVIEDTPAKEKPENEDLNQHESRKISKTKIPHRVNNLVCEFCGKTFRQLSYLNSHKLQHKNEDSKKSEKDSQTTNKSVFSCEICKKEFRKLHHLVQHRINHNPSMMPTRVLRKSSSEQSDKNAREPNTNKQNEDAAAGFRCEPCDKSFRKLHHLVEHRETHDGINRQKNIPTQINVEKPPPPPQCDICKKSFRKLHHLIEHKEQHVDTSSEKSDDKSVKSSLSTKDIIHECSLCYMVFPNEHSLNKHTVICQRKKRQSKQAKQAVENGTTEDSIENLKSEENKIEDIEPILVATEIKDDHNQTDVDIPENPEVLVTEKLEEVLVIDKQEITVTLLQKETIENPIKLVTENKPIETISAPIKIDDKVVVSEIKDVPSEVSGEIKKIDDKEIIKIQYTPKKKTLKDKVAPTVTKRQKTSSTPPLIVEDIKPAVESSDDDEIRYMFNPDFKVDDTAEGKLFMKVRAKKRNSLQIERPSSRELVKRRTSLQHPPKIPRLKAKPVETRATSNNTASLKMISKTPKLEPVPSTDSDDSDVKYSFPKPIPEKTSKLAQDRTPKEVQKRTQRKSLAEKRRSLSAIAKRKSLGKAVTARHKAKASPIKPVKKRTTEVEHRCDCGQLFSSAALLSRHVTLTHTPPRIRRRRSPPPEIETKSINKTPTRKSSVADKKQSVNLRKSSVKSDTSNTNSKASVPRKSSVTKSDVKTVSDSRKSTKAADKAEAKTSTSSAKTRRNTAHKGVPVPEKMKKLMQKTKK